MWSNPRIPFALSGSSPVIAPPDGKPIIVNLAMNIEYWPFDKPMPRGILPAPHGKTVQPPDVPNFAWVEYGLRAGLPRIMRMLTDRGLRASALMNAEVIDVYPALAEAVLEARWDFVGHGLYQQSLKDVEDEEAVIAASLERMRGFSGQEVRAWLGPGIGETLQTPDLLKKHGVDFLHDWTVDDLPCWMRTIHGPMLAMPYALDLNDVPIYAVQHSASDEMMRRIEATLAVFEREALVQPRVMTIGLHPHIIGVAHIAHHFERALDLLLSRNDVIFLTSSQIGAWFSETEIPAAVAQGQPSDDRSAG
jgi:allantoinase